MRGIVQSKANDVTDRSGIVELAFPAARNDALVRRHPDAGVGHFRLGGELVVGEDETAVFMINGRALDALGPGRHALATATLPLVTRFAVLPYGTASTFQASLVTISARSVRNRGWGTRYPIAFHDNMFGQIRLRAHGTFSARVTHPTLYANTVVRRTGVDPDRAPDAHIGDIIASRVADFVNERVDTIIDLPRYYDQATNAIGIRLANDFLRRGVELLGFHLNAITLPDDVLATLDERRSVSAVHAVSKFFRAQSAATVGLRDGEPIDSEIPVATLEADSGRGDGPADPQGLAADVGTETLDEPTDAGTRPLRCHACHSSIPPSSKFCAACGAAFCAGNPCLSCGEANAVDADFCQHCGACLVEALRCAGCSVELPDGSRFCMACGRPNRNLAPEAVA